MEKSIHNKLKAEHEAEHLTQRYLYVQTHLINKKKPPMV